MKQNKIISLGAVIVALIAVIGLAAYSMAAADTQTQTATTACQGHNKPKPFGQALTDAQKQEMEAKRTAINSALAANDYQAWLIAIGAESEEAKIITADNFSQLVKAYQLEQEGMSKLDQARQIREQLGLKGPQYGPKPGKGPFNGWGNLEKN